MKQIYIISMSSLPNLHTLLREEEYKKNVSRFYFNGNLSITLTSSSTSHNHKCRHHYSLTHSRSVSSRRCSNRKITHLNFPFEGIGSCSLMSGPTTATSSTFQFESTAHISTVQDPVTSDEAPPISVSRLIEIIRATPSCMGPVYSRRLLCRNFTALCIGHAMVTAAFVPLMALQGSISSWWWPPETTNGVITAASLQLNADIGSLFLAGLFGLGALSSLVTPLVVYKLGPNWCMILCYSGTCVFFGVHLFPRVYTLIPGYLTMGLLLGPLVGARITFLMDLASKWAYVISNEEDCEPNSSAEIARKELVVQRLSRGLQISQDLGLIVGNVCASLLLWYMSSTVEDANDSYFILDAMFRPMESNDRICGCMSCPLTIEDAAANISYAFANDSEPYQKLVLPCKTTTMLASVFLGCCIMGVALTIAFMDRLRAHIFTDREETFDFRAAVKSIKEAFMDPKLQLAAPLSVFIGLEQGFMYADFSKSYVVCALGIENIPMVFLSLGVLQSVAGFTLSMILQHIRRYLIIVIGFVFHACLLMVLLLWKPTGDDPALLYVIAAAWGVCNAIWDILNFSLITSVYPEKWQAPLAHCYFFRFLGLALAFGLHGSICNWMKLYGLAGAMILAITPYSWLELRLDAQRKVEQQVATAL